ncbi:MAG: AAA family ATPase [Alteromonadaceae bacterium]|nr:AAA family ATPase [Alteromonadaceae bacterium]
MKLRARKNAKCRVVSIVARKGGVGKTFTAIQTAVNAAFGGPEKKKPRLKVLFVDVDSQQNSTYFFLKHFGAVQSFQKVLLPKNPDCEEGQIYNITDIFMGNDFIEYPTQYENLHIIPSDGQIDNFKNEYRDMSEDDLAASTVVQFKKLIQLVEDDYDLIVIDTPPSKTNACQGAIAASTDCIVVANLDAWNAENALPGIMSDIEYNNSQFRNMENPINIAGILINKVSSVSMTNDEKKQLRSIKSQWPEHVHNRFYFVDRVAFKTTEMPQDPSKFDYMKSKDTAGQMQKFYQHISESILADIYDELEAAPKEVVNG